MNLYKRTSLDVVLWEDGELEVEGNQRSDFYCRVLGHNVELFQTKELYIRMGGLMTSRI